MVGEVIAARRSLTAFWLVGPHDRPPVVPALLPPDPDVPLDLCASVLACFDLVGYERLLPYEAHPSPSALKTGETARIDAAQHREDNN